MSIECMLMKVESNTAEVNSVPENVNTKDSKGKKKSPLNVKPVAKNLKGQNHKSKVNTNSAHGFVLTKAEVLDMLNESYPGHTTAIENLNENVLFAIPYSLMERHLRNTALKTVFGLPTEKICSGSETHLSLMDEVRINSVIEGMIGNELENQSIKGTGMSASYAESIVKDTKYRRITSSRTNKQKIIQWITSLLFVTNAMPKSKTDYWQSLIYQFHKNWLKEALRVLKPGAFMFCLMTPRQDSLASTINAIKEAGFRVDFTPIYWAYASGFPKAGNIGKLVDKRLGAERDVIGRYSRPDGTIVSTSGANTFADGGFPHTHTEKAQDITAPATPQAKALDGSYAGFQPKPAVEVIIVAMKPLSEKTYIDQALKNAKGITWLDDCRVPFESEGDKPKETDCSSFEKYEGSMMNLSNLKQGESPERTDWNWEPGKGRFPANLLVSDDVLNDGTITKSKRQLMRPDPPKDERGTWQMHPRKDGQPRGHDDYGSFSRYFSLDAWFSARIKHLPKEVQKTFPFLIVPKASKGEKNKHLNGMDEKETPFKPAGAFDGGTEKQNSKMSNFHPTVKPIALMSYLITLGSRERELVMDPFTGSGTTLVACKLTGRYGLGFEIDPEWESIIKGRLDMNQTTLLDMLYEETEAP